MSKNFSVATIVVGVFLAAASDASAHTVGVGWKPQANGDVIFYAHHWHGSIGSPVGGLIIESGPGISTPTTYNFTGIQNNIGTLSDLKTAGTIDDFALWATNFSDDTQTVSVSGLQSGTYSFRTTTNSTIVTPANSSSLSANLTVPTPAVPEPASLTLFGLGAFGMGVGAWRRRKREPAV